MSNEEKGLVSEKSALWEKVCKNYHFTSWEDKQEKMDIYSFIFDELTAEKSDTSQDDFKKGYKELYEDFKATREALNKLKEVISEVKMHDKDKFMIINELERIIEWT